MTAITQKPIWAVNAQEVMSKKGIQKNQLLDVFGVTTTGAVVHYFQGRREPSVSGIQRLADKLEMQLPDLLGIRNDSHSELAKMNGQMLTDALQILIRTIDATVEDIGVFFNLYQKMGAENIIRAANILADVGESESNVTAVIKIQEISRKAMNC
ncbi:hypothetical protein [Shewanella surugensis]|uniref:XRE family transcriptional regulator n=1 Tax=Shewanella surugensis TaxID=212020 RepID=A0ABT0LA25_9GAMM|nr:hypothetical protein [Shewanella surugensis]MCL1124210.1 hypothetical protein [Shewanella surugensis]